MAGSAPEGSQFDARQYDAKMENMCVASFSILFNCYKLVIQTLGAQTVAGTVGLLWFSDSHWADKYLSTCAKSQLER